MKSNTIPPNHHRAWLLQPLGLSVCAIAEQEIIQYLISPVIYTLPHSSPHCHQVLYWHDQLIPIMNLSVVNNQSIVTSPLTSAAVAIQQPINLKHIAILIYQTVPNIALQYLALALLVPPIKIVVTDQDVCSLPQSNQEFWQQCAKSCFLYQQQPTPILDIARLCTTQFRDWIIRFSYTEK